MLVSKASQNIYHGPSLAMIRSVGGNRRTNDVAIMTAERLRIAPMAIFRLRSILTLVMRIIGIDMTCLYQLGTTRSRTNS